MPALVMVRYGEIALKGKNRGQFEQQLQRNLKGAVKALGGNVERIHGRMLVRGPEEHEEALLEALRKVFGVVSVSPAREAALNLEAINKVILEEVSRRATGIKSFRVSARRANKKFPYQSPQLNQMAGALILENFPHLIVDLHNPGFDLTLEIGYNQAYIYLEQRPGPGGLPVGITGKALLLLSGGIDSPVAGWLSMKRGLSLEALHFHSFPFTSKHSQEKTVDLCRRLAKYGHKITLHMIGLTEIQKKLRQDCPAELGIILLRRMMLRLATRLAEERKLQALITGDNLGQVASQTLESITVVSQATDMLILRPLVGFDKAEIIKLAIDIDTYELSVLPYEDCCTVFLPKSPVTKPKLSVVKRYEELLPLEDLLDEAYGTLETTIIRRPGENQ